MKERPQIKYCKGYKYQLREKVFIQTNIHPEKTIRAELVLLTMAGLLVIDKYFAWDGCSGPTIDDDQNGVPCLVHDALAYLMRTGLLDPKKYIHLANKELDRLMVLYRPAESGIMAWARKKRANLYCWMTDRCGQAWATKPRKIYTSPKG